MKQKIKTVKYSLIESENQLEDIYGGIGLPPDIVVDIIIWVSKLEDKLYDWLESKL